MRINAFFLIVSFTCSVISSNAQQLLDYVNPLIGTDSEHDLSNGNTYPAVALPWGMNFWSPQTAKNGYGWLYAYDADKIAGLKQTHQASVWIKDYGAFSILPITGEVKLDEEKRSSFFSHKQEISKPDYYRAFLADYNVWAEITPTERAAQFRFTYPQSNEASVLIDAFHMGSYIKVIPEENKVIGYSCNNKGGVPENFKNYFVIYFDKKIEEVLTWNNGVMYSGKLEYKGEHVGAVVKFKTKAGEKVHLRVASSFISPEQAELNLKKELGEDSFDATRQKATAIWNKELSRIEVEGGTEGEKINFYTALYRILLFPRKFYEINASNEIVHYSPYNGKVLPGYMFTDNGFWDTFRAVFPFFTVMYRELDGQIMEGLVNAYKESGWLPEWASPGHRDCMIGSNSASIIANSYLKGIRNFDINTLYEAILKNSENEGPMKSVGRFGVKYYNTLGYIPYDVDVNENAARTLEYAYDDFCIMKLAKALNKPKADIDKFGKRAYNYKNLFDPSVNFMRGKNKDGSFQSPFKADKWGDAFTEGNAWHYTWSVFHDPQGLINLMGGTDKFVNKLDSVFVAPPTFDYTYYGWPLHEITEMLIAGMGQYAHGNQPIQHMIYLYDYAGTPWKAQQHVREVMDILYKPTPDGLCGDEDNGQTSAWYIFSAMGFYPVCPGAPDYAMGSPLFTKMTLHFENNAVFTIKANNNNKTNVYIDKAVLNGKEYSKNFLLHDDIMKGGTLELEMKSSPNKTRGINKEDFPYSLSNEGK